MTNKKRSKFKLEDVGKFGILILVVVVGILAVIFAKDVPATRPGATTTKIAVVTEAPTDTPTPVLVNTLPPESTPTPIDTPVPVNTLPPASTSTPMDTPTPIPTSTPTNTPTPVPVNTMPLVPTSTPTVQTVTTIGITSQTANVRAGPSINYGLVATVRQGEQVTILRRTPNNWDALWLQIRTSRQATGWILGRFINVPTNVSLANIAVAVGLPPTPVPTQTPIPTATKVVVRNILQLPQVVERLEVGEKVSFQFVSPGSELRLILISTPLQYDLTFVIYDDKGQAVGKGSYPSNDLDDDPGTYQTMWVSQLPAGYQYYVEIHNTYPGPLSYCFSSQSVEQCKGVFGK